MEPEIDLTGTDEVTPEVDESVADKIQQNDSTVEIKYSGEGLSELLKDFVAENTENDNYNIFSALLDSIDEERDYSPEEIDNLLDSTNLDEETISMFEDELIRRNQTNIARKEEFSSDIDDDVYKLNDIIAQLEEYSENCNTLACSEGCEKIKKLIEEIKEKLSSLKNSYDGDVAVWNNNIEQLNKAYQDGKKVIILPDEEEQ